MTRGLSVKRPTTKNIMPRTDSESWPNKRDIVQRTSGFSVVVVVVAVVVNVVNVVVV